MARIIEVRPPKGFTNFEVTAESKFIGNTNNSPKWDRIIFPLPKGKWSIANFNRERNFIVLIDKRNLIQRLFNM
jgi:hypothetical protein